ncbi:MAG: class I SAM-dependent methyltransferase [Spirochaetales bacterium]|nr:class I SAM-dependent methyltransferase [Spirochaetales bacterium]
MKELFSSPMGNFHLSSETNPKRNTDSSIQAWDAADEYILCRLSETKFAEDTSSKLLILNDHRGGLSCPLTGTKEAGRILVLTQSLTSRRAIEENCRRNRIQPPLFTNDDYFLKKEGNIEVILMKIPRSLSYFEYQMAGLSKTLPPGTPIIGGGMSKEMPLGFFEIFSRYTEGAEYSLIKKRARLYTGNLLSIPENKDFTYTYEVPEWDLRIKNLPGVFAMGKLDPGTRFLLEKFERLSKGFTEETPPRVIADPGCGDGVLAMAAARKWPEAKVICTDESAQAVKSAEITGLENGLQERLSIIQTDLMEGIDDGSVDLILCNPPFHTSSRVSMDLPFLFISESARVLRPGGMLLLVANRHLGYTNTLNDHFTTARTIAQNKKFTIYTCRR